MEPIEITFKSISSKNYKFNANEDDILNNFIDKLDKPDNMNCRFIYKGKVIEGITKIKDLNDNKPIVVFMFIKNKQKEQSKEQQKEQQKEQPKEESKEENKILQPSAVLDDKDKTLMGLMTSLVFIRSNPLLTVLFMNDIDRLFELLGSDQFKEIIYHVMQGDIQVKKIKKNEKKEEIEKEESIDCEFEENNKEEQELNENDELCIKELMTITGKSKEECAKAYIICNKNTNNAALMLLN